MEHDLSLLPASDLTETEEKMRQLLYRVASCFGGQMIRPFTQGCAVVIINVLIKLSREAHQLFGDVLNHESHNSHTASQPETN